MASFTVPFFLPVYWKSSVPFLGNYNVAFNSNIADGTIYVDRELSFDEFVRRVNKLCKADLRVKKMGFTLVWSNEHNERQYFMFDDDEYFSIIYLYAFNKPELYVSLRDRTPQFVDFGGSRQGVPDCIDLGGSSQAIVVAPRSLDVGGTSGFFTCSDAEFGMRYGGGSQGGFERGEGSTGFDLNVSQYGDDGSDETDRAEPGEGMSDSDTSADESYIPTDSEDDINVPDDHYVYEEPVDDSAIEDEFASDPDRWDGNPDSIGVNTLFKSKEAVQNAMVLWSARRGVNYRTIDSKKTTWAVECVTRGRGYPEAVSFSLRCPWTIRASKDRWSGKWRMVKWVDRHTCVGVVGSTSQNITQRQIAALVMPYLRADLNYKVINVQSTVRQHYNIDVSYKKAWHGRRLAIEGIFGTWESNTKELPRYMEAVKVCISRYLVFNL
jgi:hypothetical protein